MVFAGLGRTPGAFLLQKRRNTEMTSLATATILTVEDDPIVRADLRLILEDAGFEVFPEARDGLEAVELARELRPDLILLDLGLPNLDGVEAARRILHERDVPIVALTGHGNGEVLDRAVEAGASGYVLKPFSGRQLVGTLRNVLVERRERQHEHRHLQIMIERMVRDGYTEREIEHVLRQESGDPQPARRSTAELVFARIRGLLGR
jgi:DNA-binding response OmpR family regulator